MKELLATIEQKELSQPAKEFIAQHRPALADASDLTTFKKILSDAVTGGTLDQTTYSELTSLIEPAAPPKTAKGNELLATIEQKELSQPAKEFIAQHRPALAAASDLTTFKKILSDAVTGGTLDQTTYSELTSLIEPAAPPKTAKGNELLATIEQKELSQPAKEFIAQHRPALAAASDLTTFKKILSDAVTGGTLDQTTYSELTSLIEPAGPTTPPPTTATQEWTRTKAGLSLSAGLAWLVLLYVGTTWLAVGTLSSIEFRDDVHHAYNATVDTLKLKLEGWEKKKDAAEQKLADLSAQLDLRRSQLTEYQSYMNEKIVNWDKERQRISDIFKLEPEEVLDSPKWTTLCDPAQWSNETNQTKEVQLKENACRERDTLRIDYYPFSEEIKRKMSAITEADAAVTKASENSAVIFATNVIEEHNSEATDPVGDIGTRVRFMSTFGYEPMLEMPDDVLILLLAIAMGMLGSTITMTWTFLTNDESVSFRWYLLRPLVGAVSALVLFLFAKGGQVTLNSAGSEEVLSPVFISIVSIIAGLISDRAYAQMQIIGERFVGGVAVQESRWASGLKDAVAASKLKIEDLAQMLNSTVGHIEGVMERKEQASALEQQRLADRLGMPVWKLFTDVGPG